MRDKIGLVGAIGVMALLVLIVLFIGFGWNTSSEFAAIGEIISGVAVQVFNATGKAIGSGGGEPVE